MFRETLRGCSAAVMLCLASVAYGETAPPAVFPAPTPIIAESGYVRLEVTLTTTSNQHVITFQSACPKQGVFDIDLKQLLAGSDHVTLGVGITAPLMGTIDLTPVTIDKKRSGIFGKSCDVSIDQIRYLSPAYYVRTFESQSQQFSVAPAFKESKTPNPIVASALDAGLSFALTLSGVPAATAAPYAEQLKTQISQAGAETNEGFAKHLIIKPGPVPLDSDFQWKTSGLLTPKHGTPIDVILTARLIPLATLIPDPAVGASGQVAWTPADVLSAPFAANLSPTGGNTFGDYLKSSVQSYIDSYDAAANTNAARDACKPILDKVQSMGLSDRDQALLMWAVTHNQPSPSLSPFDIDSLQCLNLAWTYLPSEIQGKQVKTATPPPSPGVPPTTKQMQAATQIDDAFAVFLKTTLWAERRKIAAGLFSYPTKYDDANGLLFDSASTVENADQWLALHVAPTPMASRVGCYTYLPATGPSGKSMMYAIAETVPGHAAAEVILVETFAAVSGSDDARIDSIDVQSDPTPDQKAAILKAQGKECSSGYRPPIIFGN